SFPFGPAWCRSGLHLGLIVLWKKVAFLALRLSIEALGSPNIFYLRSLCDRHIPPGFETGNALVDVSLDDHDRGAVVVLRLLERFLQLLSGVCPHHARPKTGGIGCQIELDHVAIQAAVAAITILRPKTATATRTA